MPQQRNQARALVALKSKSSRRTVPIGKVVGMNWRCTCPSTRAKARLFLDELGDPLPYWRWKKLWTAAVKDANNRITAENEEGLNADADVAQCTLIRFRAARYATSLRPL